MLRQVGENIVIAFRSIRGQMLRSVLTILIIALGITALVGMLTSIDVLNQSISSNFAFLGANTFSIQNRGARVQFGQGGQKPKKYPKITYDQARQFKESYDFPGCVVSISAQATGAGKLKYGSKATNPNIPVIGGDENYLIAAGYEIGEGRNFTFDEVQRGNNRVIIGVEIAKALFGNEDPLNKDIRIGSDPYMVVGILKSKGAGGGFGNDRVAIIPINFLRQKYQNERTSFAITVFMKNPKIMDAAMGDATSAFRNIRKDKIGKEESFEMVRSDQLIGQLLGITKYVRYGSVLISVITLIGALIGLLNIMLVAVTERTREIGIRKAIGAKSSSIAIQFLVEALIICQLGGALGAAVGILAGFATTSMLGSTFIIPWNWIILAITVCFIVGIASGFYPAMRAARLNVVDSLRHE